MREMLIMAVTVAMAAAGCGKDDKPTAPPMGACCAPEGTCTVTTQAACSGTWTQAGVCDPNPCLQPPPPSMVLIPAGTFTMGSPLDEPGRYPDETQHQVTLTHALRVCDHEVTQAEWESALHWNDSHFHSPNKPVESITWYDCLKYCNERSISEGRTPVYTFTVTGTEGHHTTNATVGEPNWSANGYRLLTEAEWEYACRATSTTAFCNGPITHATWDCGDDPGLSLVGWYCGNAGDTTSVVGGKAANTWGLKDMHGNVWEWCWDWRGDYPTGPVTDPVGPSSGTRRVFRGGGCLRYASDCRSAVRSYYDPVNRHYSIGLRVALAAP